MEKKADGAQFKKQAQPDSRAALLRWMAGTMEPREKNEQIYNWYS